MNKAKLRRTCWTKEIEKHKQLPNLLWDQELEELLTNKPFQLDQLQEYNPQQDQLGKNNDWSIQLQQNLSENEKNKKNKKKSGLRPTMSFTRALRT